MDEYGIGRPWKIATRERQQCSDYSLRHHTPLDPHVTSDREIHGAIPGTNICTAYPS
jgi:hypothetical protein